MSENTDGKFDKYKYNQEYLKNHIRCKRVVFNKLNPEDQKMWEWLDARPEGVSPYIKSLIAKEMYKKPSGALDCKD